MCRKTSFEARRRRLAPQDDGGECGRHGCRQKSLPFKKSSPFKRRIALPTMAADGASLSDSKAVPFAFETTTTKGRRAMARTNVSHSPHDNPCAQCGKPIAAPDWIENSARRISYLWRCKACDYRFEAVAFFDASHPNREAIAA
jgi:hypothetical protein